MRLPRARFTLRSMMVFVAVVALGLAVIEEFQDGLPPRFVLRGIPGRFARLRPGMTPAEAHETLGIMRPWLLGGMGASGPAVANGTVHARHESIHTRHEYYDVHAVKIVLVLSGSPSGEIGLIRATAISGYTTIAELP
jgi:hypothetical protein